MTPTTPNALAHSDAAPVSLTIDYTSSAVGDADASDKRWTDLSNDFEVENSTGTSEWGQFEQRVFRARFQGAINVVPFPHNPTSQSEDTVPNRLTLKVRRLRAVLQNFTVRDYSEVSDFLKNSPYLIPLVDEIQEELRKYFDFDKPALRVLKDSDPDGGEQLIVSAKSNMEPIEADDLLMKFDEEWWLDNLHRAQDRVCVTLEF